MHRGNARNQRGVTLVELIFSVAIAAILASISLPVFGSLIASTYAKTAHSTLATSLNLARMSAVSRARHVVVCPSPDGIGCANSSWWQQGWIVFEDANNDHQRDSDELLIEAVNAQATGLAIHTADKRKYVSYLSDGRSQSTAMTFTFCDRRGAQAASSIIINPAGRVREGTADADKVATACANP